MPCATPFLPFRAGWAFRFSRKKLSRPRRCRTLKEYPRLMLVRPSQLRAVGEDSAFLLPSAATLTMSYRRLKCPTAIIAGQDDEIVDSEQAERLQKAMPHAAVTLVSEAGHMVHYFTADGVVKTAGVVRMEAGAL